MATLAKKKADLMGLAKRKGDDADLFVLKEVQAVDDKVDTLAQTVDEGISVAKQIKKIKGDKGDPGLSIKGDPGETPTEKQLLALIKPLIPKVENGKTPTRQELLALIQPLIPVIQDGRTPTSEELISLIKPLIPIIKDGSPDTAEDIRNKLELLIGDDRLDASAIRNLPKPSQAPGIVTGHGALFALADVDIAGIVAGQSIQWDGKKWVAYTPAGSGGTPVWGENLTTQGPGTSFTLAFTPIVGTVRLFRGGTYQSVANGDYTISEKIITLTNTLISGEVLVVDYSH